MTFRKRVDNLLLRVFGGMIDIIIILVPIFLICLYIFHFSFKVSELYTQFAFLIYNILLVDWYRGQTLGKKVGRVHVIFKEGENTSLIKKSIREAAKLLYFLPMAGPVFMVISLLVYLSKGKFLHDFAGDSMVCLEKDYIKEVKISE